MRKRIDFKRFGRQILIFLFILVLGLLNLKAQTIYSEDFSACPNGAISSPNWEVEISKASPDIFWVQNHKFDCKNIRGEGIWYSSLIDISSHAIVNASVSLSESGQTEAGDFIRVYYNVDGKGEILFSRNGNMEGRFGTVVAKQTDISGSNLQIVIHISNNELNEKHSFDNILVEAQPDANLWIGSTDSAWSNPVNWSSGIAPTLNDDVHIPRGSSYKPIIIETATCKSIFIEENAALAMAGDAELTVLGNFICMGKFLPGKGAVNFIGSEAQSVNVSKSVFFYNLGINNRSEEGVTAKGKINIRNRLHLADGFFVTSDTITLFSEDADAISGYSDTSYVVGKLQRQISNLTDLIYNFPVGLGGRFDYHPARIDVNALAGTKFLTVSFEQHTQYVPASLNARGGEFSYDYLAPEGIWVVTPDVEPTAGWYDIRLSLKNFSGLADNLFGIVKRPKGAGPETWTADFGTENVFGGEGRKLSDGYALKKYCTAFSEFTLGGGGVAIPIELLDFNAELQGGKVNINWSTASETDNAFFTIEKSNGTDFKEVSKINSEGNSSTVKTYSTVDEKPFTGISYYRLKQTDFNGKEEYSDVVSVKNASDNQFVIFPNPTEGSVKLKFNATLPKVEVIVYNQHGTISFNKTYFTQGGASVIEVQLKDELPPGIYYMQVSANQEDMLIQQIVIQ